MAQIIRHPDLNVQKAVVDGADVEVDAFAAAFRRRVGKACHTVDVGRHIVFQIPLKQYQIYHIRPHAGVAGRKNRGLK